MRSFQGATTGISHDQVGHTTLNAKVMDTYDMRMIQGNDREGLLTQGVYLFGGQLVFEDLDGSFCVKMYMLRLVHFGKAA